MSNAVNCCKQNCCTIKHEGTYNVRLWKRRKVINVSHDVTAAFHFSTLGGSCLKQFSFFIKVVWLYVCLLVMAINYVMLCYVMLSCSCIAINV